MNLEHIILGILCSVMGVVCIYLSTFLNERASGPFESDTKLVLVVVGIIWIFIGLFTIYTNIGW
jgi:hypothetical protein